MRRAAEMLPTLRESARTAETPAQPALPPPLATPPASEDVEAPASPPDAFDPAAVVRALAARNTAARASEARHTTLRDLRAAAAQDTQPGNAAARARARLAALAASHRAGKPPTPDTRDAEADGDANEARPLPSPPAPATIPRIDEPPTQTSDETRIAEAVAEAQRAAAEERERAVEAARAQEREAAEERLAEARAAWVAEEADQIRARLEESFDALHQRLSDAFGKALVPIADAAVREKAVRRFASILDDLAGADSTGEPLVVRGPADLVEALRHRMGERSGVAFEVAETAELAVTLEDTQVETTIGAWADDLAKVMGESKSNVG